MPFPISAREGRITSDEFRRRVVEDYGDPGLYAAESMCLTQEDYDLGYEHCVDKIAPALEEELMVNGGDRPHPGSPADPNVGFDDSTPTIHGTARSSIPKSYHGEGRNFVD